MESLQARLKHLLSATRPIAVNLVDSFDFHDSSLKSTLGCFDGQVYDRMLEAALKSPLNKKEVQTAYAKYLKPVMKANL